MIKIVNLLVGRMSGLKVTGGGEKNKKNGRILK
jgi:hypothetical protein